MGAQLAGIRGMDRQNLKFIFISKRVVPSYLGLYQVVPDNSYHNINNGVGPWAAATLVTDQVVLVLQCSALDSELKMIRVMHIYPPGQGQGYSCYV